MRVRVSALWDQVASRLDTGNVDTEAIQRAVLRAAGYAWDDVTGELTDWPRDVAVSPRPEERPSASPARGAACSPVDLTSPDDAARRDDDDATRVPPRGDMLPRDRLEPPLSSATSREEAERAESPVLSIAISDSGDGEHGRDAARKRGRSDEDAAHGAPAASASVLKPPPRAPSFARATSAQLERELAKHGMKPGSREYMTRELARAWAAGAALPPDFFEPEAVSRVSRRRRTGAADAAAPPPRPSETESHAGGFRKRPSVEPRGGALEDALGRFIKSNAALYDRVLTMEAVDVDEVLTTVRAAPSPPAPGVAAAKVSRAKLLAYLEREGVAVTHTSGRRARTTRTRF